MNAMLHMVVCKSMSFIPCYISELMLMMFRSLDVIIMHSQIKHEISGNKDLNGLFCLRAKEQFPSIFTTVHAKIVLLCEKRSRRDKK